MAELGQTNVGESNDTNKMPLAVTSETIASHGDQLHPEHLDDNKQSMQADKNAHNESGHHLTAHFPSDNLRLAVGRPSDTLENMDQAFDASLMRRQEKLERTMETKINELESMMKALMDLQKQTLAHQTESATSAGHLLHGVSHMPFASRLPTDRPVTGARGAAETANSPPPTSWGHEPSSSTTRRRCSHQAACYAYVSTPFSPAEDESTAFSGPPCPLRHPRGNCVKGSPWSVKGLDILFHIVCCQSC